MKRRQDLWGAMVKAFGPCSLEGNTSRLRLVRSQGGWGVVGRRLLDGEKATGEGQGGKAPGVEMPEGVHFPRG